MTVTAATAAAFSTVDGRWGGRGGSGQRRGRWFARDLTRLRNVSRRRDSWMQDDSPGRSPWESSARAAAATFLAATVRFCCTFAPRTAAREPRARLTVVMEAMATGRRCDEGW